MYDGRLSGVEKVIKMLKYISHSNNINNIFHIPTISTFFKFWKDNATLNLSINITGGTIFFIGAMKHRKLYPIL